MIKNYGSLEKAIEAAPDIKSSRYGKALDKHAEQALHAKKMVTIKTDVPEIVDWEDLDWEGPNTEQLGKFFKRMEFRSLYQKISG
ncbi:MAG: hypothetical protein U5K69_25765 [Balneolaceae bacterium]|nr:hypothetical protein [Balneolaceae bacterium]